MISSHSHNHEHSNHQHDQDHEHDHKHDHHGHNHNHHSEIENRKILLIAVIMSLILMLVEFFGGFISRSLALISDAGHMLSDSASLLMAYFAIFISSKKADSLKTFGYKRIETITAFVNGITLVIIALLICKEGVERLITPVSVNTNEMILIASVGLAVNTIMAIMLFKNSKENLNMRAALIHILGDLVDALGAIIAGIVMKYTGWLYADPPVSFLIAFLILTSSFSLLKETFHLLMEGTPKHIKLETVEKAILSDEEVVNVHDLHIWSLNDSKIMLTGHVVIQEISRSEIITCKLSKLLQEKFNIAHSTLQVETVKCNIDCN